MERNKDEAVRAWGIAEQKMQNGDFESAKKFALKAQKMFPELENLSQLLTVCDVHYCAKRKLYGSEMDWYGILQIEQSADESSIKKQCRKLAVLLHPDKNKIAGAEAAFKLIGEANGILTDKMRRSQYDMKCNISRKTAPEAASHQPNRASSVNSRYEFTNYNQDGSSESIASDFHQQAQHQTFWTCCAAAGIKDPLFVECLTCGSLVMVCPFCSQGCPLCQFSKDIEALNQGPCKVSSQCNGGNPSGIHFPHRFARQVPIPKAGSSVKIGDSKKEEKVGVQMHQPHKGFAAEQKADGFSNVRDGNKGVEMPKPRAAKLKGSETSINGGLNSELNGAHEEVKRKPSAPPEYTVPNKKSRTGESKEKDYLLEEKAIKELISALKSALDAAERHLSVISKLRNRRFSVAALPP